MKGVIGLDIGGTKVLGALYDFDGKMLAKIKKKTKADEGIEVVIKQIFKVVDGLLETEHVDLSAIGIGVPGLVNDSGEVLFSPNIPFVNFKLGQTISQKYNAKAVVGNDVNVAMYGEYKHLNDKALKNVLGVFVGTGVGGAIILDGKLYIGQGSAAEFGHMVVNVDGAYCGCGAQGCLEAYASKTAIQKYISKQVTKGRKSMLMDMLEDDGPVMKSSTLQKAYEADDSLAIEVVGRTAKYLGVAAGNLVNLFHPQVIIFGGGVIESMGSALLDMTALEARQHAMPGMIEQVEFKQSSLGDEAGIYGAYCLAMEIITQ